MLLLLSRNIISEHKLFLVLHYLEMYLEDTY